jgi:hypothetical protein
MTNANQIIYTLGLHMLRLQQLLYFLPEPQTHGALADLLLRFGCSLGFSVRAAGEATEAACICVCVCRSSFSNCDALRSLPF